MLHFKDAASWYEYNNQFGRGSLVEAVFHDLERAARNTAIMEVWGTNPRAMFDRVMSDLKDKYRGDIKKFDRLNDRGIVYQFDEIEGITRVPVNIGLANFGANTRAVTNMSKLGSAALSSFADLGTKAHAMTQTGGRNMLQAWGDNLTSALEGVAPGDRRATRGVDRRRPGRADR